MGSASLTRLNVGISGIRLAPPVVDVLPQSLEANQELLDRVAHWVWDHRGRLGKASSAELFAPSSVVVASVLRELKKERARYSFASAGGDSIAHRKSKTKMLAASSFDEEATSYRTIEHFLFEKLKAIEKFEDVTKIWDAINELLNWVTNKMHPATKDEEKGHWPLYANMIFDWVSRNQRRVGIAFFHHILFKMSKIYGYSLFNIDRALIPDMLDENPLFFGQGCVAYFLGEDPKVITLASVRDFPQDTKWKFVLVKTELGLLEIRMTDPRNNHRGLLGEKEGIASGDLMFRSPNKFQLIVEPYSSDEAYSPIFFQLVAALLQTLYPGVEVVDVRAYPDR